MSVYLQWHKSLLDEKGYEQKKYKKHYMKSTHMHMYVYARTHNHINTTI